MRIIFIALLCTATLFMVAAPQGYSATIPSDLKKIVCFIFVDKGRGLFANGTGFFVVTKNPDQTYVHGYLVTAKHVLMPDPARNDYYPFAVVRLMKKSGGVASLKLPIRPHGENKTLFIHDNDTVDIAVIPSLPNHEAYDYKAVTLEHMISKVDFMKNNVGEGTDIFFAGMFTPHIGKEHNYPIVRFGRIALISDEKILFMEKERDLILADTFSFGGNSGSPVFVYLGADRAPGSIVLGPPVLKLLGVMSGTFRKASPIETVQTATTEISFDNMGIAAVVPTIYLMEILESEQLKKLRGY